MARNGHLGNLYGKRNLAALARTGQILHASPNPYEDLGIKRSLASLAKTGQLPSQEPEIDDEATGGSESWYESEKRSIGSLARSGNMMAGKRNLASLMKNDMLPSSVSGHKKSIGSLARGNMLPGIKREFIDEERRNIAAMAREWALPKQKNTIDQGK